MFFKLIPFVCHLISTATVSAPGPETARAAAAAVADPRAIALDHQPLLISNVDSIGLS